MQPSIIYYFFFFISLQILSGWLTWQLYSRSFAHWRTGKAVFLYWAATVLTWLLVLSIWLLRPSFDITQLSLFRPVLYFAILWSLTQFFLLLIFPLAWVLQRLSHSRIDPKSSPSKNTLSRRQFLQRSAAILPLASGTPGIAGIHNALEGPLLQHHVLTFPFLPPALEGLSIAQLSDCHLGSFFTLDHLKRSLELLKPKKPDMLVITGDFIDNLELLPESLSLVSQFARSLPLGAYACMGNHEYFHSPEKIQKEFAANSIPIIMNNHLELQHNDESFYLLGVDYPWPKKLSEKSFLFNLFFTAAVSNVPTDAFSILLAHHPDFLSLGFDNRIPLTLSGHTHGGQVAWNGQNIIPFSYQYMRGLYQQNNCYGYVSTGAGHWLPFRLGCPAEITLFTCRQGSLDSV